MAQFIQYPDERGNCMKKSITRWALFWNQKGVKPSILFADGMPQFFFTRDKAREYNRQRYGYIKDRKDLRTYPHNWRMPKPVKVKIEIKELK